MDDAPLPGAGDRPALLPWGRLQARPLAREQRGVARRHDAEGQAQNHLLGHAPPGPCPSRSSAQVCGTSFALVGFVGVVHGLQGPPHFGRTSLLFVAATNKRLLAPPQSGCLTLLKLTYWFGGTRSSTFGRIRASAHQNGARNSTETERVLSFLFSSLLLSSLELSDTTIYEP